MLDQGCVTSYAAAAASKTASSPLRPMICAKRNQTFHHTNMHMGLAAIYAQHDPHLDVTPFTCHPNSDANPFRCQPHSTVEHVTGHRAACRRAQGKRTEMVRLTDKQPKAHGGRLTRHNSGEATLSAVINLDRVM